jgi:hypothetical protein
MQTAAATTPKKRKPMEYRQQAAAKARQLGLQSKYISQHGKYDDCMMFVETGQWPETWGEARPALKLVNTTLPHQQPEPVNTPLPHPKKKKSAKGVLANGRSEKGAPKYENWFAKFYPIEVSFPAWKALTKTGTDIVLICRAKSANAPSDAKAKGKGNPVFQFSFAEACKAFKVSRPTFEKTLRQVIALGFLDRVSSGGILDGKGVMANYRLSDRWKVWEPCATQERKPSKSVFTGTGKPVFTTKGKK